MDMAEGQKTASATPLQVIKAVLWSFFGVRRRADYDEGRGVAEAAAGHRRGHHRRDRCWY